jgi:hypothetical protein
MRSARYRWCKLCTTLASFRCVSSAMSSALSNLAGLTLSTLSAATSRCYIDNQLNVSVQFCGPLLTDPSSHCALSIPSGSSSRTQPLTNAFSSSRIQIYLFPERSFSPSTTRTSPFVPSIFSGLMNCGAKVPADAPPLMEPFLLESLRPRPEGRRSDTD